VCPRPSAPDEENGGRRAQAQQPRGLIALIVELVRCVGRDVDGLASAHDRLRAAKGDLDLALKKGERLLEIVAMRRRAAAGRDVHVNEAVAASRVLARQQDRVGVSYHPDVGQSFVFVRSREPEIAVEVIGRDR
jgi:hypothetical protein